ncbi:hypothetical protein [Polymorphospora sp. NPDC050346]|uniref:hypothetical protein n=1 Tax=Polymorphospora sp. NPDC050346 TaxID=3155780 RepID=UPI0033C164D5
MRLNSFDEWSTLKEVIVGLAENYVSHELSVDPDTILVNEACPELARALERKGFTVVPVRHRHRRLFGGGLHCFTLDTVREGGADDFLS